MDETANARNKYPDLNCMATQKFTYRNERKETARIASN